MGPGAGRVAGAPFDARVLADFLRTDHPRLRPLLPSSEAAQELKLLTEDCQRQIGQQTRLVNQLTATLKAEHFSPGGAAPWSERDGTETAATVGEKSLGRNR